MPQHTGGLSQYLMYVWPCIIYENEPVCSLVHCVWVCIRLSDTNSHTVHNTTHRLLRTTATTPSAEYHMQQYKTCTPEDGHIDVRTCRVITGLYTIYLIIIQLFIYIVGYAMAQLVEALRYKSEGRGFNFRWYHWNFSFDIILLVTLWHWGWLSL